MNAIASLYDLNGYEQEILPLRERGYAVDQIVLNEKTPEEMIEKLSGYAYIIASGERYTEEVIRTLREKGLKMIARLGVGYDHVDIAAAKRLGVPVTNTPGANANAVAEHALMLTLCAARMGGQADRELHKGGWIQYRPRDLSGSVFGLYGFGHIARRFAGLIRPLAGRILTYDPQPDEKAIREAGAELTDADSLLAKSDVLSLHLPLTEETRGLFDEAMFLKVRPGAIFINTSRGEIVEEEALIRALDSGRLYAAGLDVFAVEPLPENSPLRRRENCFLSPHNASLTDAAFHSLLSAAAGNILSHITGQGEMHIVNP